MGFYVEASLRAFPGDRPRIEQLARLVDGFEETLHSGGLGQVSKLFDGDPPHRPGGAIAQAWSVAELLRAKALLAEAERGALPR
jgi:glycogen debranching enzyme